MANEQDSNVVQQEAPVVERKARKSVAFSEGTTVVDENGAISHTEGKEGSKETAMSHSASMPPAAFRSCHFDFDGIGHGG
jgi:hypothetical protein